MAEATAERLRLKEEEDRHNRTQLLGNEVTRRNRRKKKSSGAASNSTMAEASEIQKSLARTQALLGNELQRVNHMASAIDEDGKVLQNTMDEHENIDVAKAKKALTNLQIAQQRERYYLMASMLFFWLVVAYIIWARVVLHMPFIDTTIHSIRKLLVG